MREFPRLIEVKPLEGYQLWAKYSDDSTGVVDLSELAGQGVFALWNDYREFQKVFIGPHGEIAWNEQVEICPDSAYLKITDQKPEDVFPQLQKQLAYA